MGRGAQRATVHGVTKSRTREKQHGIAQYQSAEHVHDTDQRTKCTHLHQVSTGLPLCYAFLSNVCKMSSVREQFQIRRIFQEIIFTQPTKSHTRIVTDSYLNHLWKYLCHIFLISELNFCNVVCKFLIKNSIETCILPYVKQIASPGWMHETSAWSWCTGMTQIGRAHV